MFVCVCVFVFAFVRQHWYALKLYEKSEFVFAERWLVFVCVCVFVFAFVRQHW